MADRWRSTSILSRLGQTTGEGVLGGDNTGQFCVAGEVLAHELNSARSEVLLVYDSCYRWALTLKETADDGDVKKPLSMNPQLQLHSNGKENEVCALDTTAIGVPWFGPCLLASIPSAHHKSWIPLH